MTLFQFIDLVDLQARASLKAEASRLYLSYLWWILEPLLFVIVFYIIFKLLLNRGSENFVFFLMCGKIPYLWLSKSIMASCESLLSNRGLIGRIDVPKTLFPFISMQEALYKQWAVFLVLFACAFYFESYPTLHWLWLIPIILTNYLLIVPLALIGTLLVTWAKDFRMLISMGLLFVMFSSGIFFDINDILNKELRDTLLIVNPMAFLIDCYRRVLMYGEPINVSHLTAIAAVSLLTTSIVYGIYKRLRYRLTQMVLNA